LQLPSKKRPAEGATGKSQGKNLEGRMGALRERGDPASGRKRDVRFFERGKMVFAK